PQTRLTLQAHSLTHARTHTHKERNTHPCLGEQSNCGWSGGSHPCPPTHTLTLEPEHNPQLLCKCMCKRTNTYTFTFTHTHTAQPSPCPPHSSSHALILSHFFL